MIGTATLYEFVCDVPECVHTFTYRAPAWLPDPAHRAARAARKAGCLVEGSDVLCPAHRSDPEAEAPYDVESLERLQAVLVHPGTRSLEHVVGAVLDAGWVSPTAHAALGTKVWHEAVQVTTVEIARALVAARLVTADDLVRVLHPDKGRHVAVVATALTPPSDGLVDPFA